MRPAKPATASRSRKLLALLLAAITLAACASSEEPAAPAAPEEELPPDGPHPLFSADPLAPLGPWPDDRLLDASGAPALPQRFEVVLPEELRTPATGPFLDSWSAQLGAAGGFGTFAPAFVRFSEEVTLDSLAGNVRLVSLGAEPALVPSHLRLASYAPLVLVYPDVPLEGGVPHAVVVVAGAETATGKRLVQSPAFFAYARGEGREAVAALSVAGGAIINDILVASTFVPARTSDGLSSAAAAVPVPGAPTILELHRAGEPGLAALFGGTVPAGVAAVATGTYPSRDLRGEDGAWGPELIADPAAAPAVGVPFLLVLPEGPAPYPVTLVLHGIGGSKEYGLAVARDLAPAGRAVLAIDASSHGGRGAPGALFNLAFLPRTRDHFRQTPFDLVQLQKLVASGGLDTDALPGPELRQDGLTFFGNSMGAIMGASYVAVAPDGLEAAVLNVGGGGISRLLELSSLEPAVRILLSGQLDADYQSPALVAAMPILLGVAQAVIDSGDPVSFGPLFRARSDRAVLLQESIDDLTVPNPASEDLARSFGLTLAEGPQSGDGPLALLFHFRREDFPELSAGTQMHDLYGALPAERRQAVRFLVSGGRELCDPRDGCD